MYRVGILREGVDANGEVHEVDMHLCDGLSLPDALAMVRSLRHGAYFARPVPLFSYGHWRHIVDRYGPLETRGKTFQVNWYDPYLDLLDEDEEDDPELRGWDEFSLPYVIDSM